MATENLDMDYSKYDFKDSTEMYVHLSKKGLTKDTVREISQLKGFKVKFLNINYNRRVEF